MAAKTEPTVTTSHAWLAADDLTLARYNYYDTLAPIRTARVLTRHMKQNHQHEFFTREVWSMLPTVLAMQERGLPYDVDKKALYRRQLRKELKATDDTLRELHEKTSNPLYAKVACAWQTLAWLNPDLNLPGWFGTAPSRRLKGKPAKPAKYNKKGELTREATPATKGAIKRRPAPFTKGEWAKVAKHISRGVKDADGKDIGFNPNSGDQLCKWLFKDLGIRPTTKTMTGQNSVNQDALSRILQRRPKNKAERELMEECKPIIHGLMHRGRLQKIDQDYLDPQVEYVNDTETRAGSISSVGSPSSLNNEQRSRKTESELGRRFDRVGPIRESHSTVEISQKRHGRIFPRIKMTGTKSGRYAYADPPIHSWPDEIRHLVAARPGHVIIGADYSAIEARVFALLTRDAHLQKLFKMQAQEPSNPRWDLHISNFTTFMDWTLDQYLEQSKTAQDASRLYAKTIQYGVFQYGGNPRTVKAKTLCPCPLCESKLPPTLSITPESRVGHTKRWFSKHPNVLTWRRRVSSTVAKTKRFTNPMSRTRLYAGPWSTEMEREAWNWPIQSTATEIIRRAARALHDLSLPLILEHHDALYAEVPIDEVSHWAPLMQSVMQQPVPEFANTVFPTDLKIGPSWGEMEDYKLGDN